jgi:chromate transport protein ChrA
MMRRAGVVGLIVGGMLLVLVGAVLLLSSFLAIDAEDEVSLATWLIPFAVGAAAVALGIVLAPRSARRAPPGGW